MRNLAAAVAFAAMAFATPALAQTSIPSSEAQPFLGTWSVALDANGQAFTMDVTIQDVEGNVAAEVGSPMGGAASKVGRIAKNEGKLVLSYSMNAEGQEFPVVMTLTPEGAEMNAVVDFAEGMFVANGRGTKQ